MAAVTEAQRRADRQDAERRRLEEAALLALLINADEARRHAITAWKLGRDPAADAAATILGSDRVSGLADRLTPGMYDAWQAGILRTVRNAERHGGIKDSDILLPVLALPDERGDAVQRQSQSDAEQVAADVADSVRERLARLFGDTPPDTPNEAAKLIRRGLAAEGIARPTINAPTGDYRLRRIADDTLGRMYFRGRGDALRSPAIAAKLYAFQFVAVRDDRTTQICRHCDGTVLQPFDPWWQTHWPLMHYNCRSQIVERYSDEKYLPEFTDPPPTQQAMPGFGLMPMPLSASLISAA